MSEVTGLSELERGYRRLVAFFPRSFRAENSEEIITVLLATASEGQRRPGLAESFDLLAGAFRMHMGLSRAPGSVVTAVRLMCLGAAAELAVLVTVLVTEGSIRAQAVARYPHYAAAVTRDVSHDITGDMVILPILVLAWLWVAWGNGRGSQLARVAAIVFAALYTLVLVTELAEGVALVAPAAMIVSGVAWALGVGSVVYVLRPQSWPYYERPARGHAQDALV
jgi:hypothetical protein